MGWMIRVAACLVAVCLLSEASACTAFQLKSQDGALIYCRSMEYAFPMESNLLIVARNEMFKGTAPNKKPGLQWKSKYGFVGMNQIMDRTTVSDGMNEKGLVAGCLYLPGFAGYEVPSESQFSKTLGPWEVVTFLLTSCQSVQDVKAILPTIMVAQEGTPGMGEFVIPLHFYVCDQTGASLVIEYVGGKCFTYDNPLGVLTNSPPFPWHMANLTNYMNLSPVNVPLLQLGNLKLKSVGEGSGFLGLPGDYTPPSRFVKAAFFSQAAITPKTAKETVCLGFHILNTFDIFEGAVQRLPEMRDGQLENIPPNQENLETTQWTVVHDRINLKTYFRSYGSLSVQMVDLNKINFAMPGRSQILMKKEFVTEDVTTKTVVFKP